MILDSPYLIDLFQDHDGARWKARQMHNDGIVQRVPETVMGELHLARIYATDEEERRVRYALGKYPVVKNEEVEHLYGKLLGYADRETKADFRMDASDGVVAAASKKYDEPVVTSHHDKFTEIGIQVEPYEGRHNPY